MDQTIRKAFEFRNTGHFQTAPNHQLDDISELKTSHGFCG
jgi:hypothetical protein